MAMEARSLEARLEARCLKERDGLGGSASPTSSLSDNSKVSSSPSAAAAKAALQAVKGQLRPRDEPDLASRLALAEAELREHSGPSSNEDSEERDSLHLAQQVEEELERRSNAGSLASSDAATTPKDLRSGGTGNDDASSESRGPPVSNPSSSGSIRDLIANFHSDHSAFHSDHSKSGSGTRSAMRSEDDPKSSSSSSNTQQHRTNMELWEVLLAQQKKADSEDPVAELHSMMATMAEKHGMEMDAMQRQLRKTLKREIGKSEEKAQLTTQVAGAEAKHAEKTEELKAMYHTMHAMKKQFDEEKGDLQDWIAGQEARSNAKIKNLKMEFATKLKTEKLEAEATEEQKKEMAERNAALEKELASIKAASKHTAAERDVLRRNLQNMQSSHQQHVSTLKEQLSIANQELKSVVKSKLESEDQDAEKPVDPNLDNLTKVVDLREQLVEQRETHREMRDELSELRVKMLGLKASAEAQEKEKASLDEKANNVAKSQVGDLAMLLEAADVRLGDLNIEGMPKAVNSLKLHRPRFQPGTRTMRAKGKSGAFMKLGAIDEDDISSIGASAAASGNVSSDGGDEVGDLHDFDENPILFDADQASAAGAVVKHVVQQKLEMKYKLDELQEKLAEDHILVDEAKEELAEKEARHASKVARLMDVVESSNSSKEKAEREVRELKELLRVQEAEHSAEKRELQEMLTTSQDIGGKIRSEHEEAIKTQLPQAVPSVIQGEAERDPVTENLWQQLCGALEAKRIAEGRVEEFKRAMASMERQHNDVVAELKQQLLVANGSTRRDHNISESCITSASEELEDLKQQLRSSIEEKNVLANSLEWKEVQWKSKVENMEMNHAAAIADLRRRHEVESKEMTLRLESELTEVRQQLETAQARAKIEEKVREPAVQPSAPSWLTLLRCPVRAGGPSASLDTAAYCQDVCWKILNTIQGITALLCSIHDYKILQATRTACMTWGSAALHGQSVLTLVNGPSRAAWLRKAFLMHQSIADTQNEGVPGFVVRDLGCEEFTSKSGQAFDSSVITAHLPAEPGLNKEAALLLIIEPQANQQQQRGPLSSSSSSVPQQPVGRVEPRQGNQSSAHSEVSTVDPSDSASNIFNRNAGMFFRA